MSFCRHCLAIFTLTLIASVMAVGCATPVTPFDQLWNELRPQTGPVQQIQPLPPVEILPAEHPALEEGTERAQSTPHAIESGSTTPVQLLEPAVSPSPSPTPSETETPPGGSHSTDPAFTFTPSASPTTINSPTITQTLPAGTQPISPSHTPTVTRTATFMVTPTPTTFDLSQETTQIPATATGTPEPAPPPACNPSGNGSFESALIALINKERRDRGLGTLSTQGQLTMAARDHSVDMACNGFFAHTGSDGSLPWDRVSALGYNYSAIAENIFAGSSNAQTAFNAWLSSPGHSDNMLNPTYTEIGIGYRAWTDSPYGAYTTAVFALPQ